MWVRHPDFLDVVRNSWNDPTGEQGMLNLQLKLGRVKKSLKWWNKYVFGNIFEMIKQADLEAQEALAKFEQDRTLEFRSEMNRTAAQLVLG